MNSLKPNKIFRNFRWNVAALCGVFLFFSGVSSALGEIVAITHKKNSLSSLTVLDLKKMYQGEKLQWDNGEAVKLFLPRSNCEEMEFVIKKIFRFKSQVQIAKYYIKATLQRKWAKLPETANGTTDSISKVAHNAGGIAFIDLSKVKNNENIKLINVVSIEGL